MMDQPSMRELVEAVRDFLEQKAMPELKGHTAFHARVAANVLAIVRRELTLGPDADRSDAARLAALLGVAGEASALNQELCRRIEAGEIAPDDPALLEHLWATTLDTLAIDQPGYATYRRIVADDPARGDG